ncbi:hypothetical protein GDO78_020002 [Eleutherodactylus coqui]|uniref:Uncharacterized protein n=1 Tax=Eleutherodactylus coqui TaxID=57060 RepID=A0A8J6BBV4_ELECQ|nr:hypothetical protein GDO78_020002 [Eleutherodactylus coqui]
MAGASDCVVAKHKSMYLSTLLDCAITESLGSTSHPGSLRTTSHMFFITREVIAYLSRGDIPDLETSHI